MPSDPSTWATLQASVESWLGQDFTDAQVQEFIALGERHLQRTLFTPDRESASSLSADAVAEALPADFWGFKSGPYVDGSTDTVLTRVTPAMLRTSFPDGTTGALTHFAIEGENILFGPAPAAATSIKGTYYATIPALGAGQATNWLLTDHPDLYLAAALVEGFAYHLDEARAAWWERKRDRKIADVNAAGTRRSANSGPLTAASGYASVANVLA